MATNLLKAFPDLLLVRDDTGDFKKFITILEESLDLLFKDVSQFSDVWDVQNCNQRFLPYLAQKLGWDLDTTKSVQIQRKTVSLIGKVYRGKGVKQGVIDAVRLLLAVDAFIVELYAGDGWIIGDPGHTELGKTTILSGTTGASPYHFIVFLPNVLSPEEDLALRGIIDWMKPDWTHYSIIIGTPP